MVLICRCKLIFVSKIMHQKWPYFDGNCIIAKLALKYWPLMARLFVHYLPVYSYEISGRFLIQIKGNIELFNSSPGMLHRIITL